MFKASDRQAVENTIMRRDWRIALGLTPDYDGFDASVLCNFRKRLIAGNRADELFRTVLAVVHELGLFKKVCKVRVDATALLAATALNVRRLPACLGSSPDTPVGGVFRAFSGFAQACQSAARTARSGGAGRFCALRRFPGAAAPSGC